MHRTAYARLSRGIIADPETQLVVPQRASMDNAPAVRYMCAQKEVLSDAHACVLPLLFCGFGGCDD